MKSRSSTKELRGTFALMAALSVASWLLVVLCLISHTPPTVIVVGYVVFIGLFLLKAWLENVKIDQDVLLISLFWIFALTLSALGTGGRLIYRAKHTP